MAEMAPIESHFFTSLARGCSRSPPPVFSLYSLKAASRIELRSEGGVLGVWTAVDEDMVLATRDDLLVMVAESRGKHEAQSHLAAISVQGLGTNHVERWCILGLAQLRTGARARSADHETVLLGDNRMSNNDRQV